MTLNHEVVDSFLALAITESQSAQSTGPNFFRLGPKNCL